MEFHTQEDMPEQLALFRENNEEVPSWKDVDAIAARFEKIKDKIPELDKLLNERAADGWELVTYDYMATSAQIKGAFVVTFRKEKA